MKTTGQKMSRKHEDRLARELGGARTAASGAFWSRKGDVRNQDLLLEHKWTGKSQFTLKSEVLSKITREAILDGRTPILGVSLGGVDYVILHESDFMEMYRESQWEQPSITGAKTPSVQESTPTPSTRPGTRRYTSRSQIKPRRYAGVGTLDLSAESDGTACGTQSTVMKSTGSGGACPTVSETPRCEGGSEPTDSVGRPSVTTFRTV